MSMMSMITMAIVRRRAIAVAVAMTVALTWLLYDYKRIAIDAVDLDLLLLRGTHDAYDAYDAYEANDTHTPNLKSTRKKIRRPIHTSTHDTLTTTIFDDIDVKVPNVTDRQTLLTMARLAQNAYVTPSDESWIPPPSPLTTVESFGWRNSDDGLRGHIFASSDNSSVVVSIKGTSAGLIGGGGPSAKNDKFNDNLLFSCCCARVSWTWTPVCDCYAGGWACREQCLERAVQADSVYYPDATQLLDRISFAYPHADIWLTGHSLGGALASMLGLTFGLPAVTFEAPGDRIPAQRLHLPSIPPELTAVWHVYHTADPVAQGTCNGLLSPCNAVGFALETRCHTGMSIVYDTVSKLGWAVDLRHHRILTVIKEILEQEWEDDDGVAYVPKPTSEEDCIDCFKWEFGEVEEVE
ncbi:hypothetical protein E3P78_00535 [Wallemia ichthyophaga]|nr:hypothetical protein E3P78_00535 [Wallemia ichthyophaga]